MGHNRFVAAATRLFGWRLDRHIYRLSGGRFSLMGPDVMLLTTTGRRTGLPRQTPVIHVREGEKLVISSEDFGQGRPAAWPLNLDANPAATVTIGTTTSGYRARRLGDEEADAYWPALLRVCPAHATYWKRSGKRHVYLLEPAD